MTIRYDILDLTIEGFKHGISLYREFIPSHGSPHLGNGAHCTGSIATARPPDIVATDSTIHKAIGSLVTGHSQKYWRQERPQRLFPH